MTTTHDLPTGRALIEHIADLAQQVAAGDLDRTGELADAANSLQRVFDRHYGNQYLGGAGSIRDTDDRANLRNMLWPPHSYGALAVPAGRVRRAFGRGNGAVSPEADAAGWLVNLLPTVLPEDDDALVLLYRCRSIDPLLMAIGEGHDRQAAVDALAGRLARRPMSESEREAL